MSKFVSVILLASLLGPSAISAQEILSPEEFKSYAEGKTLYFSQQGQPFGVEQYLPGQHSIWQYKDGTCIQGIWYTRKTLICFVYEGDGQEQCWHFLQKGKRFAARAEGRESEADLEVVWRDDEPIQCKAPDLGV